VRTVAIAILALGALALAPGCRRETKRAEPDAATAALALVEARRFDEAIARIGDGADADGLYALGLAWAGKAESAPLPTPAPGSELPASGLFKAEELTALGFMERAVASRPDHARAQLALAELLAPHALAGVAAAQRAGAKPALQPPAVPDASVERVLRSYGDAIQADPAATAAAESLVRFATAAGRLAEADSGFQELLRRRREDASLLVRYGDFLAGPRGTPEAALSQYAQALIWRADDIGIRTKIAGIHLAAAAGLVAERAYGAAEVRLKDARRFGAAEAPALAPRLRELEQRVREVRGR